MRKVTTIGQLCCAAALLAVTACGGNGLTGPTNSSNSPVAAAQDGSARASLSHYNDPTAVGTGGNSAISCPTQQPKIFHAGVLENRLEFQWQPVANVHRYQLEVERFTPGNTWVPYAFIQYVDEVLAELYGSIGGRYRLRVRSITACGTEGSWSEWHLLSIDGPPEDEAEEDDPFIPGPPVQDDTKTYWLRVSGSDQAAESGCSNPGGGQTGTYLGGGLCEINTPAEGVVMPPQSGQWEPADPPV
jgi:hypothetical protein